MAILRTVLSVLNYVLYFAWSAIDRIFQAFGLTWLGVVCGLAVISVLLRLFARNLVGTSVAVYQDHRKAQRAQGAEKHKAAAARGRGASTSSRKG